MALTNLPFSSARAAIARRRLAPALSTSYESTSQNRSISLKPAGWRSLLVALIMFEKGVWSQMFNGGLWTLLEDILGLASMVFFFAIIGYVAEGALGIPLLCLFRRIRRLTLPWFLLGGVVIGVVVSIVVSIFFGEPYSYLVFPILYCIAPAVISTTVFWFIGWAADNKALQLTAR